jgi:NADPH:quinone reductase-like Zn-dependent oxidoreductase
MKAITYTQYGSPDVLRLSEVDKPTPKENEVLVKVRSASLNALDWHLMRGKPFAVRLIMGGISKPKITLPGRDLAGIVDVVGKNVTQFKPGDEVFGTASGTCAEYVCSDENKIVLKSANIAFEEAAACGIAAITALQGLRDKGAIKPGQKILIDGSGGGVGTFAVQIAKSLGAEVTAVCNTKNLETAKSIGADHIIDYTKENFTKSGKLYDLIFGANAYHSIFDYRRSLNKNGIFVGAGGGSQSLLPMICELILQSLLSKFTNKKMSTFMAKINQTDLKFLNELLSKKKILPVIDKRYSLSETAEAMRYLEEGHVKGKIVINI